MQRDFTRDVCSVGNPDSGYAIWIVTCYVVNPIIFNYSSQLLLQKKLGASVESILLPFK